MNISKLYDKFNAILKSLCWRYKWFNLITPQSSMTNTELFYIYLHIVQHKCPLIFESGVGTGRSTIILSECMKEFGNVISANFKYPGETHLSLQNFTNDYSNLNIINGLGEEIIKSIDKQSSIIGVIDGPKTNQHGWSKLINEFRSFNQLLYIFQHDVANDCHKKAFEKTNNFEKEYITKKFLDLYPLYGSRESWKMKIPNLGKLILKR